MHVHGQSFSGMIYSQASAWSWPLFHEGIFGGLKETTSSCFRIFHFHQTMTASVDENFRRRKNDTTSNSVQPINLPPGLRKLQLVLVSSLFTTVADHMNIITHLHAFQLWISIEGIVRLGLLYSSMDRCFRTKIGAAGGVV